MAVGRVIDTDKGYSRIVRKMDDADGIKVAVGFTAPEAGAIVHDETDLSNVQIAALLEFGAPIAGIPERSVLRATFDAKIDSWNALFVTVAEKIYSTEQESPVRLLGIIGEKAKADMINTINAGIPPPLKAATIARKGSSKPWIDTGQVKGSITWKIRR
jgi:hypothetical protein